MPSAKQAVRSEKAARPCALCVAACKASVPCGFPNPPTTRAPKRPRDEYRLEEEANESLRVGVQAERVDVVEILIEVTGKNQHIEESQQGTYLGFVAPKQQHRKPQHNFHHTRSQNYEICESITETEPHRHLGYEVQTMEGEVTNTGIGHESTQKKAQNSF